MKNGKSDMKKFFDKLVDNNVDVNIIISTADCKKCCNLAERNFNNRLERLETFRRDYPTFNLKFVKESHTKMVLFKYASKHVSLVGGRNLSESSWNDMSLVLNGKSIFTRLKREWTSLLDRATDNNEAKVLTIEKDVGVVVKKARLIKDKPAIVESIINFYDSKGFISSKQKGVLEKNIA